MQYLQQKRPDPLGQAFCLLQFENNRGILECKKSRRRGAYAFAQVAECNYRALLGC